MILTVEGAQLASYDELYDELLGQPQERGDLNESKNWVSRSGKVVDLVVDYSGLILVTFNDEKSVDRVVKQGSICVNNKETTLKPMKINFILPVRNSLGSFSEKVGRFLTKK